MNDKEKLSCLTDRPCTACKFHKEKGCSKWSCVFEEKSDVPEREKGTLEKIRAEIEQEKFEYEQIKDFTRYYGLGIALKIIDKYKCVPEREKGEWIEREGYDGDPYYECSICEKPWDTFEGTPRDNGMNFCPSCGADMRGDKAK